MDEAAILLVMVMSLTPAPESDKAPPRTTERRSIDVPTKLAQQGDACPGNCTCGCLDGGECLCAEKPKGKERKIEVLCAGASSYAAPTYRYSPPVAYTYSVPTYSYAAPSYTYSAPSYSYTRPAYSYAPSYSYARPAYTYSAPAYRGYSSYAYSAPSYGYSSGRSFGGGGVVCGPSG